jgi:hypothetical protein
MSTWMFRFLFLGVLVFTVSKLSAQTKVKAGVGINYISNNFPEEHLNDYLAFSFNLSYTLFRHQNFSVAVESATSLRKKEENDQTSVGVTSLLPVTLQYQLKKTLIYAGSGPAYLKQKESSYQYNQKVSGAYLNFTAGVGLSSKPFLLDVIYPEYNIRFSFLKSFSGNQENAGMISLILYLRGV